MVPSEPKDEFDYETNTSAFSVSIRATDEYGAFTEGNFTLTLLDVNESIDLDPDQNQTATITPQTHPIIIQLYQ